MAVLHVKDYLQSQKVKFHSTTHSPAFTSQEIAAAAHISGKDLAKIVIVKADGKLVMVVLPADHQINFAKLRKVLGTKAVDLATESEFKDKFAGCEVGAMPPFGHLYNMPVFVHSDLTTHDRLIFNGGSHSELIELAYRDFERLEHPKVMGF
jgi:Ala-tRNA(Pro) deacylase